MTGPVAAFADAYRAELFERGYTPLSTVNEVRQAARFSRWLEAGGLTVAGVSEVRVEEFLVWQRVNWCHRHSWSRLGLRCLLDVLSGLGVLAAEKPARGARRRLCCWRVLSVICLPSGGWRRAWWFYTRRPFAGSWTACRRTAGLLGWQRGM